MKFAKLEYSNGFSPNRNSYEDFYHLILESTEDVSTYFDIYSDIHSHRVVDIWKREKESLRPFSHMPYSSEDTLAWVASQKLSAVHGKVSLPEFCNYMDSMQIQKFLTMNQMIIEGNTIRLNHLGGYSPMSIFEITEELEYLNSLQLKKWILTGDIDGILCKITSKVLIIENDSSIPRLFKDWLKDNLDGYKSRSPHDGIQVLTEFNMKTRDFSYDEWFQLFDEGIKNGLKEIYTYTTLTNTQQVSQVKRILKKVMEKHPDKKLEVTVLCSVTSQTDLLKTSAKNIKINVIELV